MTTMISRRELLLSLPALTLAPRAFAQAGSPPIRVRGFNHVALSVSDVKRSVDFYQGLFGMPVLSRQGPTTNLRIGGDPQFLEIAPAGSNAPRIHHLCLGVDDFNVDRITGILKQRGIDKWLATGGPGSTGGAPGLYFTDQDGIVIQLQDPRYCGGTGPLGSVCPAPEPSPKKGLLALSGWSHCTIFESDGARANAFYQDLFGLRVQAYQGPNAPVLGVGGVQFLMFAGGGGRGRGGAAAAPAAGSINHLCMNMENFNPERVIAELERYGIKPRASAQGPAGPLVHYISMRMENRGGAKEGTPELYFTDPDGLLIQLQDVKYCGGGGVLGDACSA
jgi:catechol 2,3-dioxygenase-like lactoylglutathione lyase family enzyme